jgi:hypothetical protein
MAGLKRPHWLLLVAAAVALIWVAGSAAVLLRDDKEATAPHPTGTTGKRPNAPAERSTPSVSVSLPPGAVTDCMGMFATSADGSGLVPVPGPADPPLVPADAMAGVNQTMHGTNGQQAVEIHFPATRIVDLVGERTEIVETVWGDTDATVWYAPYGLQDTVQVRVPTRLPPPCDVWDITVRGPDVPANRALAIKIASGEA